MLKDEKNRMHLNSSYHVPKLTKQLESLLFFFLGKEVHENVGEVMRQKNCTHIFIQEVSLNDSGSVLCNITLSKLESWDDSYMGLLIFI